MSASPSIRAISFTLDSSLATATSLVAHAAFRALGDDEMLVGKDGDLRQVA